MISQPVKLACSLTVAVVSALICFIIFGTTGGGHTPLALSSEMNFYTHSTSAQAPNTESNASSLEIDHMAILRTEQKLAIAEAKQDLREKHARERARAARRAAAAAAAAAAQQQQQQQAAQQASPAPAPAPQAPSGGIFSFSQLESLWVGAGGPPGVAATAAQIAECESGGNPNATNPSSSAAGLWQILGLPFPGNPYDPGTNAAMAVAKYKGAGDSFSPWVCQ